MKCPLLLSPAESGRVETMITNSTTQEVRLFVREYINRSSDSPAATQIAVLSPTESKTLIWMIDSSNLMFNRLILVNILQSQYGDNPSRLGSCGILLFSLFGLGGAQTFGLLFASSLVGILFGCGLWIYARHQLNDWSSVTQAGGFLGALTIAALLSSVVRWWGLILVFDFLILLLAGTLMTEFIVLPGVRRPQW